MYSTRTQTFEKLGHFSGGTTDVAQIGRNAGKMEMSKFLF